MKTTIIILSLLFIAYVAYCWYKDTRPPQPGSQKLWEEEKRKEREAFLAKYKADHPDNNNTGYAGEA